MQVTTFGLALVIVTLGLWLGAWLGQSRCRAVLAVCSAICVVVYLLTFASLEHFQQATPALAWISVVSLFFASGLVGPSLTTTLWVQIACSLAAALIAGSALLYLALAYACAIEAACL